MHIRVTPAYILSFLLLLLVMMELHELVHIITGRFICGCWGPRDFNVWSLCEGCSNKMPFWWVATLAGPLFSFLVMWVGMYWLNANDSMFRALGFSLIFSNIPFGRITTVMMGGGDEMVVIKTFLQADWSRTEMILLGSAIVLALGVPPVVVAYRMINNSYRWIYITGFLTVPLFFLLMYTLGALNTILSGGFLSTPWILGTPLFITLHTALAAILLFLLRKNLFLLNKTDNN